MKRILFLSVTLLFFGGTAVKAQEDSIDIPYKKGMWLAGLSGSLSSINIDRVSGQQTKLKLNNEYDFLISSGKFIRDKTVLGVVFRAGRNEESDILQQSREILTVGPYFRYYLGRKEHGSLFIQFGALYINLNERLQSLDVRVPLNRKLKGEGLGFNAGIGYSYFFTKNVGFDISMQYDVFGVETLDRDFELNTEEKDFANFTRSSFLFGFIILIPEFMY